MKKVIAMSLSLVLLLSAATGCGQSSDSSSGGSTASQTVVAQIYGDVMSFCPNINSDDNYQFAAENIFNRLTKLDNDLNVLPDLATDWAYSEDGLDLTFHLQEGATWHDGESVTAEDVAYTFQYIKEHETCPFNSYMSSVDSVEAVDNTTVVFHLNTPDASLVAMLGWNNTFVLPKHIYDNGQDWSENDATLNHPIGSGPFKFVEYTRGSSLVLEANDDYFGGRPQLDRLVYSIIPDDTTAMQALINGELDWTQNTPTNMLSDVENNENIRLSLRTLPSPTRMVFNLENELVSDQAVRTAIAMCIDREDISEKTTNGVMPVEYSAYPSDTWAANTTDLYPECDLEAAEQVLIDAGYEKDADGYYIRGLTIDVFEQTPYPDAARLIAANCEKIGIEMTVQVYEYNAWAQKVEGFDFCVELQGGFMGPDPNTLYSRLVPGAWGNVGSYSNDRVTELLTLGNQETDQAARKEIYDEIQKIVVEELPYINILEYGVYEGSNAAVKDLPIDGVGEWGYNEWSHAYFEQ